MNEMIQILEMLKELNTRLARIENNLENKLYELEKRVSALEKKVG